MSDADGAELFARYLAGELRPDERAELERRLTTDAELREVLYEYRVAWDSAAALVPDREPPLEWDVDAGWRSLQDRVEAEESRPPRQLQYEVAGRRREQFFGRWMPHAVRAAAAFVVLVVGALLVHGWLQSTAGPERLVATGVAERQWVNLGCFSVEHR